MRRKRILQASVLAMGLLLAAPLHAASGPYAGIDAAAAIATNDNYRSHVENGGAAVPFVGFMFDDHLGVQMDLPVYFQPPDDNDDRPQPNLSHPHQWTTAMGLTIGPRLVLPLSYYSTDLYVVGAGGGFKGMGARLNQWAPGFNLGGGIDFNLTDQFSIGVFARWNRLYMAPHPTYLVGHVDNDQGAKDAQFLTTGLSLKYAYGPQPQSGPALAPVAWPTPPTRDRLQADSAPPPSPAPAEPPVVKKKIILRSVHFDSNKANLRADAEPILLEAVATLQQANGQAVIVEGHTDNRGGDLHNLGLSQRRAAVVVGFFVQHGVEPKRIHSVALGSSQPVASNDTDDGRAQNRRVELHLE